MLRKMVRKLWIEMCKILLGAKVILKVHDVYGEDEDQVLETRQKQCMAECGQHNITIINLANTSDRLLLLQAKEAVNVKLREDEM